MSIEQLDRIDFISTTPQGKIELKISDHLDWIDADSHSLLLQDKIALYLEFIETGQLVENYPDALDKEIVIFVHMKFHPSEKGLMDLEHMETFFKEKDIEFKWQILDKI